MNHEPSQEQRKVLITKKEPDLPLWQRIQGLAHGTVPEKVEAVVLIFDNYAVVPDEADSLLKEMAQPTSPVEIRREIAEKLVAKPEIPWVLHLTLLETLSTDSDKTVTATIEPVWRSYKALNESLVPFSKQIQLIKDIVPVDLIENVIKQAQIAIPKPFIEEIAQRIKGLSPDIISMMQAKMKDMALYRIPQFYADTLVNLRLSQENILRNLSIAAPSYYAGEQQLVQMGPSKNPLISKLGTIPSGRKHWHDYQSAGKDILTFCFVPPLLDPIEESRTEKGIHRRDIIYHIPHGISGFWGYVQNTFSASALIVDAKNYSKRLPKDQVIITSKYFGASKLGNFGLIISRKGPHDSARAQQIDRWVHHQEMIICLSDADLEQMVIQKENNNDPETILDKHIFELRKLI